MLFWVEQAFVGRDEIRAPLKTPAWEASGYAISRQNNLELHLGCHTCWLSYFTLLCLWCGWTVSRSVYGYVITKFSRVGNITKFSYPWCSAFQTSKTSKTTSYRPHTSELKSISKHELLFHWRNFEKYMVFYTLPWSGWNSTRKLWNTCVVSFAIAELSQKCLKAAPTLKYELFNSCINVLSVWIRKIFKCYAS